MEDFVTILLFLLFFVVLPALDSRRKKRQRRAQQQGQPEAETTFERMQRQIEEAGERAERAAAEAEREVEAARAARRPDESVVLPRPKPARSGLGDLWAEIEKLSRGEGPDLEDVGMEPAPAPQPAPRPSPIPTVARSDASRLQRPEQPAPVPVRGRGDSVITPRRAAPPPLEPPPKRPHTGRVTHSHGRRHSLLPSSFTREDLRRAVLYREILGPPVTMRPSVPVTPRGRRPLRLDPGPWRLRRPPFRSGCSRPL